MGTVGDDGVLGKFIGQKGYQNEIKVKEKLRGQETPKVNVANELNSNSRVLIAYSSLILNELRNGANGGPNSRLVL